MAETQQQSSESQPQLPLGSDQKTAEQTPSEQPPGQGESLAPAEIAIEVEEPQPAEKPPEQQRPQEAREEEVVIDSAPTSPPGYVPKKHIPAKQRINQLTAQMKAAQERAAEEQRRRELAEAAIEQWKARVAATERQSVAIFGEQLKAQIEQAKNAISAAKAAGDEKAEADAITKLARLSADQSSVEAYLSRFQQQQPQVQPRPVQQQRSQPQAQRPQVRPEVENWIKENPWYDDRSEEFDPDMHQVAFAASLRLDAKYRRMGQEAKIGTKEYLAEIDKVMREEFPEEFGEVSSAAQQPLRMQPRGPGAAVSPHNNALPAGFKQVGKQISVQLTPEEREVARSWVRTHKDGRAWTDAEKERRFAELKYKQATGKDVGGVEINVNVRGSK